ncbi:MAG: uncharacterized protein JWN17_2217, partial [Frankiales bacterium]|nr:uncharacterized protein [Frankiales bacterium]
MKRLQLSAVVVCLVLPLAACGGKAATEPGQAAPTSAAAAGTPTTGASQATDTEDAQVVAITVTGGKATGDTRRADIKLGTRVRLTVTADVVDEVHVHGYDLMKDTVVGQPVDVEFVA